MPDNVVGKIVYQIGVELAPDAKQNASQLGQQLQQAANRQGGSPVASSNSAITNSPVGAARIDPVAYSAGRGYGLTAATANLAAAQQRLSGGLPAAISAYQNLLQFSDGNVHTSMATSVARLQYQQATSFGSYGPGNAAGARTFQQQMVARMDTGAMLGPGDSSGRQEFQRQMAARSPGIYGPGSPGGIADYRRIMAGRDLGDFGPGTLPGQLEYERQMRRRLSASPVLGPGNAEGVRGYGEAMRRPMYGPGNDAGEMEYRRRSGIFDAPGGPIYGPGNDRGEMEYRRRTGIIGGGDGGGDVGDAIMSGRGGGGGIRGAGFLNAIGNPNTRLGLFGRFLGTHSLMTGVRALSADSEYRAQLMETQGDSRAQLAATLAYRTRLSGMTYGLAGFIQDPSGTGEARVNMQIAGADATDAATRGMVSRGADRLAMRDKGALTGRPFGAGRDILSESQAHSATVRGLRASMSDALAERREQITAAARTEVGDLSAFDKQIQSRMKQGPPETMRDRVSEARDQLVREAVAERMQDPTKRMERKLGEDIDAAGKVFVGKVRDISEKLAIQGGVARGEARAREGYGLTGSMRAVAGLHRVNGNGTVDGLSPGMIGFDDALATYKGDQSNAVIDYGRTVLGSLNRRAVNNRILARDPLGAALAGRHGQFLDATLGMNPNSPDYQRAQGDEADDNAVTRQRIGDSYAQINLGLRAQIGQNRLLAQYKPIEAGFLGLNAGAQSQIAQAQLTGNQTLIDNARTAGTTSIDAGMANFLRSLRPTEGSINRVDFSGGQTGNESFDDIVAAAAAAKDAIDKADPLKTFAPDLGAADGTSGTAAQNNLLTEIRNALFTIRDSKVVISAQ